MPEQHHGARVSALGGSYRIRLYPWEEVRAVVIALGISLTAVASARAAGYVPTPIGVGPRFHPPAAPAAVLRGRPLGILRCGPTSARFGVHVELFARGRVVIVPAGIGVARPFDRDGAFVRPRGCTYPLRTLDPTGVVEVAMSGRHTLGDLFHIWGQPLSPTRLAGFRTAATHPVRAYLAGRRWHGALRALPLRRHAAIAVELGRYIRPHRLFLFRPGL